jgi:acetyl/propionyl-CoA carboxylase alpha subunit
MLDKNLNPMKFSESPSAWARSFSLEPIKCLIVCRGPVRKEAIDMFDASGIREYGMLLSEKDSVIYPKALAPELRNFRFPDNVHRVPDYMGSGKEEKTSRINEIIHIAKSNNYTHLFAGYGFMAEDSEFIEAIENSGLSFMGPSSHVAKEAGAKDEAKKLARSLKVSVTPGVDNITALALLRKVGNTEKGLTDLAKKSNLNFSFDSKISLEDNAEVLLQASYVKAIDLVSIPDLQNEAKIQTKEKIWSQFPGKRVRYKYIGGGGGKGQRVISDESKIEEAVMEILAESKVVQEGSNRNFLIELNIENTRHNEIQLIGNGEWCLSLGGRDCSVQMHEQKLLELSLTKEQLEKEIEESSNQPEKAEVLKKDKVCLMEMERESETFGQAVHLDSVSTFESIVEGTNHFFMEMNTRIQVEHRVTEMVYRLKFTNPSDKEDFFYVDSLIEAMALLSLHGKRVPKPERVVRNIAGGEVRINATNISLQPHAGGIIQSWSPALPDEIRDDQGIGTKNPDTGAFVHYHLAGAYDSNIALVITNGTSRKDNLERLGNILRKTEIRGQDLQTNIIVHYGLISWILGQDAMFKPATSFMISYLAGVGSIAGKIRDLDLEFAWNQILSKKEADAKPVLKRKLTLITRPIEKLVSNPHLFAGFIGYHQNRSWKWVGDKLQFLVNPIQILDNLYTYLNMEENPNIPASEKIWDHDSIILKDAISFYHSLETYGLSPIWSEAESILESGKDFSNGQLTKDFLKSVQASHKGFQLGLELLSILPKIARLSSFDQIRVEKNLEATIPDIFKDAKTRDPLIKNLNPPIKSSSDEIIAPMGGMYYSKEAPNLPPLIQEGESFKKGQPLFIIEVMKMFNKILAPTSGKVIKNNLINQDGKIIKKGDLVFKIQPDEVVKEESEDEIKKRMEKFTLELL